MTTIRGKITALALASTMLALVVTFVFSAFYTIKSAREQAARELNTLAKVTAINNQAAVLFDDGKASEETLNALSVRPDILSAEVLFANGKTLARKSFRQDSGFTRHNLAIDVLHRLSQTFSGEFRQAYSITIEHPILMNGSTLGHIRLQADLTPMWIGIFYSFGVYTAAVALAFMVSVLLVHHMRRSITAPIERLSSSAKSIAETSQYSLRVEKQTEDELGNLIDQFNIMLGEIERRDLELSSYNEQLEMQIQFRTQELRKALEAAESASMAKSQFLSNMSHELRTPLNAIIGFSELLKEDIADPAQQKDIAEIHNAGKHLLRLINDILDISRIESGSIEIHPEPVQLGPLLQECRLMLQPMARKYGVSLREANDITASVFLLADYIKLKQVLLNLISNAIKYNRHGGTVEFSVTPTTMQEGEGLRLHIKDSGIGIPSQKLDEIFQPFSRLGMENSGIEGSGIGLALTRKMVELMGGGIGVDSEEGVGSTFWLEFPLAGLTEYAPALPEKEPYPYAQQPFQSESAKKILYIEDNPANRNLMEAMLKRLGHIELTMAPDAESGIAAAAALVPDLILLDIGLPDADGYQACARLQGLAHVRHVPIIAVTARATQSDIEQVKQSGFAGYLSKPLSLNELQDMLARHLGSE